jgi:hypothetical protein
MSAHRIQDERPADVVRLVGRGLVATTAALTLTGAGAGPALATPGHGGDGHGNGHGNGHEDGESSGYSDQDPADCGASGDDLVGGLLGDLGLGGSHSRDSSHAASCDTGSSSDDSDSQGTSSSSDSSGTQQASAPRQYTPSNPADIPPPPGETKIIDIPDRSAS